MSDSNQPIVDELRSQARAYDPAVPAELNRRIRSALAAVESPARGPVISWFRWPVAATVLAGAVLAAALVYQQKRPAPAVVRTPPNRTTPAVATSQHGGTIADANLVALAQRWVDQPLQGEMENFLTDLTRTKETVTRVLPAAAKRAKPTTATGAPQGA